MRRLTVIAAALAAVAAAGCSSSTTSPSAGSSPATGTITVFAAASLTESFTQLGKQFEAAHPGDTVKFSFGPSSGLAEQIKSGAPADVFASAAPVNMQDVVSSGDASSPQNFAKNTMEVATPPDNPGNVESVKDLADDSVKVALCQPQVPCGVVAAKVFKNAGITVKPVTLQPDVKSVLTQVETGNVDAGMVYVTDVQADGGDIVEVVTSTSQHPSRDWLKIVKSTRARTKINQWLKVEERARSIELLIARRLRPAFARELQIIIVKYAGLLLPQQWQGFLSEKDRQIVFEERIVLPLRFVENCGFPGANRRLNIHGS